MIEPGRTFQSEFETSDKLKRCRVNDPDHIGESTFPIADRKGPHIKLIQQALNNWALGAGGDPKVVIKGSEIADQRFGPDTANAVIAFKTKLDIKNYQNKIDPIVGKNTIRWLDDYMPYFPIGPQPVTATITDVVLRLIGGRTHQANADGEVLIGADLRQYTQRLRALVRIGRGARLIRSEAEGQVNEVVGLITAIKNAQNEATKLGVVCLYGSSAGGRNIIEVARRLTSAGIHLNYVGIADAAFFDSDTTPPSASDAVGRPRTPLFSGAGVTADATKNFFQTWGNKVTMSRQLRRLIWTSTGKEEHGEIHGEVSGFRPRNQDALVTENLRADSGLAHNELCGKRLSLGEIEGDIVAILNALAPK